MKNNEHDSEHVINATRPILSGFLVGSVVGAVTALLLAPRSGEEMRTEIRDKALEARERAVELRDQAVETRDRATETVKSRVADVKDNVRGKVEELKQRGKYTINQQLERVSDAAETGKQTVQDY